MTIAMAWVGKQKDGLRHLYFASDSRTRGGGGVFNSCPKVLTLPRSDCAICFAGNLDWSYLLMAQLSNAIAAHKPSRNRKLDIAHLKDHLLRVATDLVNSMIDTHTPISKRNRRNLYLEGTRGVPVISCFGQSISM